MKKYFLAVGVASVLLLAGTAQAAETPTTRVLKAFENVRQARTYYVVSQSKQDTSIKFANKKEQADFNKTKLKSLLSSVNQTEAIVDKTDINNIKQSSVSKFTGGVYDSMTIEAVKYDGYEYLRFSTSSQPSGLWSRSTSSIEIFRGLIYDATSSADNINILEYAIKKQPKIVKFTKAGENIIDEKITEHFSVNLKEAAAKKVWEGFLKNKGLKSEIYKAVKTSVSSVKNMKFDIWLEKGTNNLVQYNFSAQNIVKEKKSTTNINSLTEVTYKSINEPVAIFQPLDYEGAATSTSSTTSTK